MSNYKWHKYNLNVICDKCRHAIPFQSPEGKPLCDECGTGSDASWEEAVEFSKISKVKQYETGSTTLGGFMSISMNYGHVEKIRCFQCNHELHIPAPAQSHTCENCNHTHILKPLYDKDLVFYFHPNEKTGPQDSAIAVRCASCGAPCEADKFKPEFQCTSCDTLNIVPPSLRGKKVLDDIYVGWKPWKTK